MRSCVETCKKIIAIAPDGEFKTELTAFVDGVFLELPEDPFDKYWRPAGKIIGKHFPGNSCEYTIWQLEAARIWFNQENDMREKKNVTPPTPEDVAAVRPASFSEIAGVVSEELFYSQCVVAALPVVARRLPTSANMDILASRAFDLADAMVAERNRRAETSDAGAKKQK